MPPYRWSDPVVVAFVAIPIALAVTLVWATFTAWRRSGASESASRRAAVIVAADAAAWMVLAWAAAMSGSLQQWDTRPRPFLFAIVGTRLLSLILAFAGVGTRIAQYMPLWAIVAIQSFRLPLELAMHALSERGIMPIQMTYTGRNFDIVTGTTAILVAILVKTGYGGHRLVMVWNVLGLSLLVNVVSVAIATMPLIRAFADDHVVTVLPSPALVLLPAVMVLAALAGHLVIFRAVCRL